MQAIDAFQINQKRDQIWRRMISGIGLLIIVLTVAIGAFLVVQGVGTFTVYRHTIFEFLFSSQWSPADDFVGGGKVGAAVFIVGTLLTSLLALVLAVPLSVSVAIFMTVIAPNRIAQLFQSVVEVFAGIPSVVYGWLGLTVVVPQIARWFPSSIGFSVLAAGIVLAIMIFPTVTTLSADAIRSVPKTYWQASYALGSTRWQALYRAILPTSATGISTGVVLGLSRAMGEALAVAMVIGKMKAFPTSLLSPTSNLTGAIASDMGGAASGGEFNMALWSMALLLYLMSLFFIVVIHRMANKSRLRKGIS